MELTPPVARYEQVARQLRKRIIDGEFPEGSTLPSGPELADQLGVSQPVVQRAFEVLAREGLVRTASGSGTSVLPRHRWEIELGARLPMPDDAADEVAARVSQALAAAVTEQPAISGATASRIGDGVRVRMTVESADLLAALAALTPVARQAFGALSVAVLSAKQNG